MESEDIKFEIIKKIKTVENLQKFCKLNRQNVKFCKNNGDTISKIILDNLHVDYTDATNFIYVINKKNIDSYKDTDGKWKYKSLFKLYMEYYYKPEIKYTDLDITSFPIYPNMINYYGKDNKLKSFPVQPNMEIFWGDNNRLTSFPIQPNMKIFSGENNRLISFPVQPEMIDFWGDNNRLTSFPVQPKMEVFDANNNRLKSFPVQPEMIYFSAKNNQFVNYQCNDQPKIKTCNT